MKKILDDAQIKKIDQFQNTSSRIMNPKEMAILDAPLLFPNTNKPRLYKELEKKTIEVFKELTFLFQHLPPSYKIRIIGSRNLDDFVEILLNLNTLTENLDDKTKNIRVRLATQFFYNSFAAIKSSLPKEYKQPMLDTAIPFLKWLEAISNHEQKNSPIKLIGLHIPNMLS